MVDCLLVSFLSGGYNLHWFSDALGLVLNIFTFAKLMNFYCKVPLIILGKSFLLE